MRFVDSTLKVLIAQSLGLIAVFFASLAISRVLGPEGKGLVALILATAEILYGIANLGHGFSVQYFLGKKTTEPAKLLANQLFFPPLVAAVAAVAFILAYPLLQSSLQGIPFADMYPAAILVFLYMFFQPCCQYLVGRGRVNEFAAYTLIKNYLSLFLILAVLFLATPDVELIMWSYIVATLFVDILTVRACKTETGELSLKPSLALFKKTFRYSRWIYLSTMIREIAKRTDLIMVFALTSVSWAGVYSVAFNLVAPLRMIPLAVQTIFFPKTSAQTDEDAAVTTPLYHRQMIIVMLGGAALIAIFSNPVLKLFGPDFVAGQIPLLILLGAATFRGLSGIVSLHILGRGKSFTMTLMTILQLVAMIALNAFLIPPYGIIGAAIAATSAEAVHYFAWLCLYKSLMKGKLGELFAVSVADIKLTISEGINYLGKMKDQLKRFRP